MDMSPLLTLACVLALVDFTLGLDRDLSCAVCRALVEEVDYSISKVDTKKTIQVGSFRVDPNGNQKTYEIPYARSEVNLMETFENICDKFHDYAQTTNTAGKKSVGRTSARDGKTLALKDIKIDSDSQKLLKFKCENIVEDHEEEMISLFRRDTIPVSELEKLICGEIASQCSEEDLEIPMPVTEYADVDEAMALKKEDEDIEADTVLETNPDSEGSEKEEL